MGNKATERMRLLPWSLLGSVLAMTVMMFVGTIHELRGDTPTNSKTYIINGREFTQDGITYDIPQAGDPSRTAEVVRFGAKRDSTYTGVGYRGIIEIPPYIYVDSVRYTVTAIRKGASPYDSQDDRYTITLPPTLKYCDWTWDKLDEARPNFYHLMGVDNVNVTDLDTFLLMRHFRQKMNRSKYAYRESNDGRSHCGKWGLLLNGTPVRSVVLPEGANLDSVILFNCGSIRSLTIPASDTIRQTPVDWGEKDDMNVNTIPGMGYINLLDTLKFKDGVSGYNLELYRIATKNIELPSDMTDFAGFGGTYTPFGYYPDKGNTKITKWPKNLQTLSATFGVIEPILMSEVPSTVTSVGNSSEKKCNLKGSDGIMVPKNWNGISQCSIDLSDGPSTVVIEHSSEALKIGAPNPVFKLGDRQVAIRIERNIKSFSPRIYASGTNISSITFGENVTEVSGSVLNFDHKASMGGMTFEFKSITPPECMNASAIPTGWFSLAKLVVPKVAVAAYRNHPVWGRFQRISSAVAGITADRDIVSERWYSLDGRLLTTPRPGEMGICVTTYSDGTTSHRKMVVPAPAAE